MAVDQDLVGCNPTSDNLIRLKSVQASRGSVRVRLSAMTSFRVSIRAILVAGSNPTLVATLGPWVLYA